MLGVAPYNTFQISMLMFLKIGSVCHSVKPKIADERAKSKVGCFDFINSHVCFVVVARPDIDFLFASNTASCVNTCEVNSVLACSPICEVVRCAVVGVWCGVHVVNQTLSVYQCFAESQWICS